MQVRRALSRTEGEDDGILPMRGLEQLFQTKVRRRNRELAYELDARRLGDSHQLKEPQLLDLYLVPRLQHLHLLKPKSDFSALHVQLGACPDDLAGLCQNELGPRSDDERVLEVGVGLGLKRLEILTDDVPAQNLGRAGDAASTASRLARCRLGVMNEALLIR